MELSEKLIVWRCIKKPPSPKEEIKDMIFIRCKHFRVALHRELKRIFMSLTSQFDENSFYHHATGHDGNTFLRVSENGCCGFDDLS